ncbi:MAG: hypothetical protein KGJ59_01460 [Bacteroidota bacterium]|nr:hypothetical protein [Bacteroidota bacterium]
METPNVLDISKLPQNAQSALREIYNLLREKKEAPKKRFEYVFSHPVKVEKIILPSREERNAR